MLRVNEITPPQVAPLAEVRAEVRAQVQASAEAAALLNIAQTAEKVLKDGESFEAAAKMLGLEGALELAATRLSSQLPRAVLDAAFAMVAWDETALRTVPVPGEGYAIVQLARVGRGSEAIESRRATADRRATYQ